MSRLIDADALEREEWSLCRTFQKDKDTMVYEVKKPSDFPVIEERKTGRWIDDNCSECGQYVYHGDVRNFCPNCGADMRGERDGS